MSLVGIRLRYEGEWMSLTEAGDSVGNSCKLGRRHNDNTVTSLLVHSTIAWE